MQFEQSIFDKPDWSTLDEYTNWIEERGLKIFLLLNDTVVGTSRTPKIIGSFNVFVENNIAYMGGFALTKNKRSLGLSKTLSDKLIEEYGDYSILCKTNPLDGAMRSVLTKKGFTNKLDKFENGKIWSYWVRKPTN